MLLAAVTSATHAAAAQQLDAQGDGRAIPKARVVGTLHSVVPLPVLGTSHIQRGVELVGSREMRHGTRESGWTAQAWASAHLAPAGRAAPPPGIAPCAAPRRAAAPWQPPRRCPGWLPAGAPRSCQAQRSTCAHAGLGATRTAPFSGCSILPLQQARGRELSMLGGPPGPGSRHHSGGRGSLHTVAAIDGLSQ